MQTASPPPRRKWHFKRWFIVLTVAISAWGGWRVYDKRSAIKEAEALGWTVQYTEPSKEIYADWRNAFRKGTWTDGVSWVGIPTIDDLEQHVDVLHRLNPTHLTIDDATSLHNPRSFRPLTRLKSVIVLSGTRLENIDGLAGLPALQNLKIYSSSHLKNVDALKNLSTLEHLDLLYCTGLTNLDGLKNHIALESVGFLGCTGLTNVDALKSLPALEEVYLRHCMGLKRESVDALRAALPNTRIEWP
ncbi:MAG: hypothetical protein RL088_3184 [Verrucomicrobiota bacterium]|jgi:hypothetical protein